MGDAIRFDANDGHLGLAPPFCISEQRQQTPLATGSDSWAKPGPVYAREGRAGGQKKKEEEKTNGVE